MGSPTKSQILFFDLLFCCVTLVTGSLSDGCEVNAQQVYRNGSPKEYFLDSFMNHSVETFNQMDPLNIDARNYFVALWDSISEIIKTFNINSPRTFCQDYYNEDPICIEAISHFGVNADTPGVDAFQFMYFHRIYNDLTNENSEKLAIMYDYHEELFKIALKFDNGFLPTVVTYCSNPGAFLQLIWD